MTATIQPLDGAPALSVGWRPGWRLLLSLSGVLAVIASIPLLVGAVRQERKEVAVPKVYALIHLNRSVPRIIDNPADRESEADFVRFIHSQKFIIQSDPILLNVLKRDEVKRLGVSDRDAPLDWLRAGLKVEELADSALVRVSFQGKGAAESAVIANAVAQQYVGDYAGLERNARAARVTVLERILCECRDDLGRKKRVCEKLAKEGGADTRVMDDLRYDVCAAEETRDWLRRECERQRVELTAPSRVQLWQVAEIP